MREIVFRGKRKDTGEWVYGDLFYKDGLVGKEDDHFYILNADMMGISEREVIPDTVGEYTGLKDRKGAKIFEGDVLETFEHGQIRQLWTVSFKEGCFVATLYDSFICKEFTKIALEQIEVIGNIHGKPELAEGDGAERCVKSG
jgi:uncharacterized phage protein (TIGR01671 family)